jgi:hypothetical protein
VPPSAEQIERFEVSLTLRIVGLLAERPYTFLRVDYDPDHDLSAALADAKIHAFGALPYKTTVHVSAERIDVYRGYQTPRTTLYLSKREAAVDALNEVLAAHDPFREEGKGASDPQLSEEESDRIFDVWYRTRAEALAWLAPLIEHSTRNGGRWLPADVAADAFVHAQKAEAAR